MRRTRQSCAVWVHLVDGAHRSPQPCMLFFVGAWHDESPELLDVRCEGCQLFSETFKCGFSLGLSRSITGREKKDSGCARSATF